MNDDNDANRSVPMAAHMVPEVHKMVTAIEAVSVYSYFDTWKKVYDMYSSEDWIIITMENCNDY